MIQITLVESVLVTIVIARGRVTAGRMFCCDTNIMIDRAGVGVSMVMV